MTVDEKRVLLTDNEPKNRDGVLRVGPADPNERLRVAFLLNPLRSILNAGSPNAITRPN
jgi:hypothetical protein